MRWSEWVPFVLLVALIWLLMVMAFTAGESSARQERPMACEARCVETWKNGRLLKIQCPDSTGAMR
jgi:hypothetical protein